MDASLDSTVPHKKPVDRKPSLPMIFSGGALLTSALALTLVISGVFPAPQSPTASNQPIPTIGDGGYRYMANTPGRDMLLGSPNLIADVAEDIAPSVVNIDIQKRGQVMMQNPLGNDLFQRFFGFGGIPGTQQQAIVRGNGSGVVISADGNILTNNHVIKGADDITVTLNDGRKFPAKVVGRDPFTDLAVLKMEGATGLKPARLGQSAKLRPGEWVIAVGSPLGFDHTVTFGIVSALSRQVPDINSNVEFVQTDAAINPGNSGGPLVNLQGEVIGINTAIAGSGQNIGFAIPVDTARKVSNDLLNNHGTVTRPWIGISMAELKPELAKSLGLSDAVKGVIVAQVIPNSPSFKAGFQQGDVIQRINGALVSSPRDIQDLVRNKPINSELNFQILRNGQMNALSVRTEVLPNNDPLDPQ